jgi:AcrR family transcriptional regulator
MKWFIIRDMNMKKPPSQLGRPRAFDIEKAMDIALRVFWEKGYEGTSLSDLTEAMGINRPSLYAAFGDKEALFRKVLDRYAEGPAAYVREALKEPTARAAIERLLRGTVDLATSPGNPQGCLMVQGALACGDGANAIRQELNSRRAEGDTAIRERLERAKSEGELPLGVDAGELARYFTTVVHGMAVQAAGGASRDELLRVAETALRAWPE